MQETKGKRNEFFLGMDFPYSGVNTGTTVPEEEVAMSLLSSEKNLSRACSQRWPFRLMFIYMTSQSASAPGI